MVVKALREVGVPVCAIADFDILSEEQPLRAVVEALGLTWTSAAADWKIVRDSLNSTKPELSTAEVKENIQRLLADITESPFPSVKKEEIQKVLRRSSPWSSAKAVGKNFVPSGNAAQACERLLGTLRNAGLQIVEVGELEGFLRTVGGHGPQWVNEVLRRDLAEDPQLEEARKFVRQITAFLKPDGVNAKLVPDQKAG